MDLIDDDAHGQNAPEFTVSEISGAVKRVIEGEFGRVRVRGELGRVSFPRSGHVYLDLKDDRNVLAAVIWKGVASRLATRPEEGMEVVATGRLTTFGGQSRYQMVIEEMAPAGAGALMAMLEKRKAMLAAEGLFAAERKRPLPYLPGVIGVITSPSGAVIRDILHRLRDRFPAHVLVWPVAVQGERCAPEVTAAIRGFNALAPGGPVPRPDLLIVARGGGSIEDLWGFNDEAVVRAAADSDIPLISAVGHETDTTLIDHAADRRAPTPTAAAEIAVPVRLELANLIDGHASRLARAAMQSVGLRRQRLRDLGRALPRPDALTAQAQQRFDHLSERLPGALRALTRTKRLRLGEGGAGLRLRVLTARLRDRRDTCAQWGARLAPGLTRATQAHRRELVRLAERLRPALERRVLGAEHRERAVALGERLETAARALLQQRGDRLAQLERLRQTLGYTETLKRGYAVVHAGDGGVVTSRAKAEAAAALEIEFQDGRVGVTVGSAPRAPRKPGGGGSAPPDQGSLF